MVENNERDKHINLSVCYVCKECGEYIDKNEVKSRTIDFDDENYQVEYGEDNYRILIIGLCTCPDCETLDDIESVSSYFRARGKKIPRFLLQMIIEDGEYDEDEDVDDEIDYDRFRDYSVELVKRKLEKEVSEINDQETDESDSNDDKYRVYSSQPLWSKEEIDAIFDDDDDYIIGGENREIDEYRVHSRLVRFIENTLLPKELVDGMENGEYCLKCKKFHNTYPNECERHTFGIKWNGHKYRFR